MNLLCLYSNVNSICHDFGMQLLKNDTVKQQENHLSGTWGDAEQESGGVVRKQFDLIFLLIFKICRDRASLKRRWRDCS